MAGLAHDGKRFFLITSYAERHAAKAVGGRWDPENRIWVLPASFNMDTFEMMKTVFDNLEISGKADEHLQELNRRREALLKHSASLQLGDAPDYPLPNGLTLYDYQKVGAHFLSVRRRAILGDYIGLGKTAQAIVAADACKAQHILVIAPKSVLLQWANEIAKFSWDGRVAILGKTEAIPRDARWLVCTYEAIIVKDKDEIGRTVISARPDLKKWADCLIVDEAVRMKNRKAQRTLAIFDLAKHVDCLWPMTGTPIRNRPYDLWPMLHAINPKEFRGYWKFVYDWCEVTDNGFGTDVGGLKEDRIPAFQMMLMPYMLQRDRTVLNLPPLSHQFVRLPLDKGADKAYKSMVEHMVAITNDGQILAAPTVLAQLTRLRQIAVDPALVDVPGDSAKTEWLLDWMEDHAEDHKVLVFCTFAKYIERLMANKAFQKYKPVTITGQVSAEGRRRAAEELRENKKCRALAATVDAAGEGVNAQAADVVVFINKPWTPDLVEQCIGRAYRRGQDKPVHVYHLIAKGTAEEDLEEILREKKEIADEARIQREVVMRILRRGD